MATCQLLLEPEELQRSRNLLCASQRCYHKGQWFDDGIACSSYCFNCKCITGQNLLLCCSNQVIERPSKLSETSNVTHRSSKHDWFDWSVFVANRQLKIWATQTWVNNAWINQSKSVTVYKLTVAECTCLESWHKEQYTNIGRIRLTQSIKTS